MSRPPYGQHVKLSNRENITWSGASFNLPLKVPSHGSDVEKWQFFYQTVNAIQSANTSFHNKIRALSSCFKTCKIILKECKGHVCTFHSEDKRQPMLSHSAYAFMNARLLDPDGHPLTYSMADILALTDIHWIFFEFIIDPSQAYGHCQAPVESFQAAVAIPEIFRSNGVTPNIQNLDELMSIKTVLE
jgi:hypothetical protein